MDNQFQETTPLMIDDYLFPPSRDGLEKINSPVQSHVIIVTVYDSF